MHRVSTQQAKTVCVQLAPVVGKQLDCKSEYLFNFFFLKDHKEPCDLKYLEHILMLFIYLEMFSKSY